MGGRRGEKIWLPAKRMTELPGNKLLYLPNYNAHYSFPPKPPENLAAFCYVACYKLLLCA
jgi:hypothetical protein